ncbi:MAG: HAD-IC family P-type ATPase, partial [Parcubacteria group bacterium]|nr:HAD-IC family P-type ATPase [Parcubacteria group bacterium]
MGEVTLGNRLLWYQKTASEVLEAFSVDAKQGLHERDVSELRKKHGRNIFHVHERPHWWKTLGYQFRNPLIAILLGAALMTGIVGRTIDAVIILLAVCINTAIGFFMEAQSNRIFESLQRVVAVQARLRRNGGYIERDASDIVPGDIVILTLGSKVPADMRLILVNNVEIDEAILTGESLPVKKHGGTLSHTCALADQTNMAFMGTIVTEGSGIGVVVATGLNTEIGKIAHMSSRARGATPLQERMATLGLWISGAIVLSSVFIVIAGILSDTLGLVDLLTLAVAVAVAAIPEGLPAALSVVLAISAERILARDGLVRKIVAAETLGSTTVICTDKTGTLTEGKMEVEELLMCRDRKSALRALAFANEVAIEHSTEGPIMRGEATDQSKMRYAFAHGFDLIAEDRFFPRVALLGFDPTRKYIASLHSVARDPARQILFVAGAPEVVLAHSTRIARSSGHESLERARERELKDLHDLTATQGYRVIAIAMKEFKASFRNAEPSPDFVTGKVRNLTFLGFAVLRDPVRREVRTALAATRAAGMRVIMVTGDHMHTARAVAHELGFPTGKDAILTGSEIDMLTDEELLKRVSNLSLIARMNPEHKLRLVETLKAHGEVVAMTGDGVNDVPALKRADIGIALGSGTEAAKEASSLVLLDNSFQT